MEPVIGKLVCSCSGVGEGNLLNKIREGCSDLLQLCQLSGAGMGCGSCKTEVRSILARETGDELAIALNETEEKIEPFQPVRA